MMGNGGSDGKGYELKIMKNWYSTMCIVLSVSIIIM